MKMLRNSFKKKKRKRDKNWANKTFWLRSKVIRMDSIFINHRIIHSNPSISDTIFSFIYFFKYESLNVMFHTILAYGNSMIFVETANGAVASKH